MLIGMIRPVETTTVEVTGDSLEDIETQLTAQTPDGFELVSAPMQINAGAQGVTAVGTFARRDQVTEIEADDMPSLEAKVPEGWQLLAVRAV